MAATRRIIVTRGAMALRGVMAQQRLRVADVAAALDVSTRLVSHLRVGRSRPSLDLAFEIQKTFSVPAPLWTRLAEPERQGTG